MSDLIERQAVLDAMYALCGTGETLKDNPWRDNPHIDAITDAINDLPRAEPTEGWNNHQIACMLTDLFGDACACNFNGIDEWLPELCDFKDTCCPNPVGVACWEQFLKYIKSRYTECGYEVRRWRMSDMTRAEAIDELCRLVSYIPIMLIDTVPKHQKDRFVRALKVGINSLKIDEQYDLMYEQAEPNCPYYVIDDDGHGLCLNHSEQKYCQDCKHNDEWDNEICLECEYDGHTRGMTRYELQEPCGDLISRQAVLDIVNNPLNIRLDEIIKKLPSVNPQEPKTGHWIDIDSKSFELHRVYKCSGCGITEIEYPESIYRHFRYCPNCGCRMVEPKESEDKG